MAASDPANPYGSILPWWPAGPDDAPHSMARVSGAAVILVNGRLAAFFRRRNPHVRVFLPEDEPDRSTFSRGLATGLAEVAIRRQSRRGGLLIETIDDTPARDHPLAVFLEQAGFHDTALGFHMRRVKPAPASEQPEEDETEPA
jgi:ATP-dependent Lhr-like helicase